MTDHKTVTVLSGISSAIKPTPSANVDINPTTHNDNDEKSSNKKTKTGNEKVVLLSSNSFLSAEESVFSIDRSRILEFIIAQLNQETLLICRLVSRRYGCTSARNVYKRWSKIPQVFLQQSLQCSPNLVEVFVWPQYLPHLVLPLNRLHLLKHLCVKFESGYMDELGVVANNHGGNWAVEEIDLGTYYKDWAPAMVAQAKEVVRQFLEGCAATCLKLEWDDALENFQFPVMPRVKHFRLCYSETVWTEEIVSNFPEIERLAHTFPNLKSLEVKTDLDRNCYLAMENVFGNDVPAPV